MDTFMEKLAERFTAQEMIKANTVAEQEEAERLKAQVQEYTACLDRMKQICADMEHTADLAKNKVEEAQLNTDGLKAELLKMWDDMQASMQDKKEEAAVPVQEDHMAERLTEQMVTLTSRLETDLNAQMDTKLGAQTENIRTAQNTGLEALKNVMERQIAGLQSGLDARLQQIADKPQGIQSEEMQRSQAAQIEQIKRLQDEQTNSIRTMQQDQLDDLRSVLKAQLSGIKEGQNQSEFIVGELESQRNTIDTKLEEIKAGVSEQLSSSNEFVHRECVKVYRNVQAVIGEENNKQTDNLDDAFKPMKEKVKKIFTISVIALVASVAGVVLQILSLLHIF